MITLTGIDERTDLSVIKKLSCQQVEFAVLLTADPEGRQRYPSIKFIAEALDVLKDELAVHVCGRIARTMCLNGAFDKMLSKASRIQVNGKVTSDELKDFLSLYHTQTIITQHTADNRRLLVEWGDDRHALLVDNSGGRGILPSEWKKPSTAKAVGFAGGLGPDNLLAEMSKMPLSYKSWVDMESSLRDEQNWFRVEKAEKCINLWRGFCP